jgi:uncharacterized protein (DUF427 family)
MAREMKIPGPSHPITIEPFPGQVSVTWKGVTVATTRHALKLTEASYPPVYYVPRGDVRPDLLQVSQTTTYCPYKGEASYLSLAQNADVTVDAIWTYEHPYPAVAPIAGHVAFYPAKVDRIDVT